MHLEADLYDRIAVKPDASAREVIRKLRRLWGPDKPLAARMRREHRHRTIRGVLELHASAQHVMLAVLTGGVE